MDNRTLGRNVHFYDATDPNRLLGGLVQNGSITRKNALDMLDIILVRDKPIQVVCRTSGTVLEAGDSPLGEGDYLVSSGGEINLSNEVWVHRVLSYNVSGREDRFCHGVRARDGRCVISGVINRNASVRWTGWEAAHVFPLEKESLWVEQNFGRWISDMDDSMGLSKINSVQNGILLQATVHKLFDQYLISVNPDDGYKIVVFQLDDHSLDGRVLEPICRRPDDPHRVPDHLLRWHFRQSVLANIRSAGEPVFEDDFPPGTDIMRELEKGPLAKEHFELELASRLRMKGADWCDGH